MRLWPSATNFPERESFVLTTYDGDVQAQRRDQSRRSGLLAKKTSCTRRSCNHPCGSCRAAKRWPRKSPPKLPNYRGGRIDSLRKSKSSPHRHGNANQRDRRFSLSTTEETVKSRVKSILDKARGKRPDARRDDRV